MRHFLPAIHLGVLVGLILTCTICPGIADGIAIPAAERPVQDFPLGVYWPWERTKSIAKNAGMERWAFTRKTCELLKSRGVDSIWLVNIMADDLKSLLKITRPLGLTLAPCLSEIEPKNCRGMMGLDPSASDFQAKAMEYYARRIPEIVRNIGDDRQGVLAWVLCDEPTGVFIDLMDPMRRTFAKADPDRSVLAISMWPQTPDLIAKTRLTTFCVDLYPFFGPNDPNGPHTPDASRGFYSSHLQQIVKDAGRDGRTGWVMPMCFNEIWGPKAMDPEGLVRALPGAYIHWRTPTRAEMRWQIWEGLRLGAKGIFFYTLLGEADGEPDAKPPEDPALQSVLVKEATPVGHSGLLGRRGEPNPLCDEMSMLFGKLALHKALLRRLSPTDTQWIAADGGAQVGSFIDNSARDRYAIVVNPDFGATQVVKLAAPAGTEFLTDLLAGKRLPLKASENTVGNSMIEIRLKAGDGVLLKVH
jgi:hypothetical protein